MKASANLKQEHGATLLLVAGLLPLLALLIGLSIELNEFYLDRKYTQTTIDAAVRIAARKLPYSKITEQTARDFLKAHLQPAPGQQISVNADGSSVAINVTRPAFFSLTSLYNTADTPAVITYTSSSRAVLNPRNIVIFVDNSAYMSPALDLKHEQGWGGPRYWPAAQIFRNLNRPELHGQQVSARIMTQQCFNPSFSALKEAAIRFYDFQSAGDMNQVGVFMGPDPVNSRVFQVRPLGAAAPDSTGNFPYYRTAFAKDEWCLAASESSAAYYGYTLPTLSDGISSPLLNRSRIDSDDYSLLPASSSSVTVREIIWSKAATRAAPGSAQIQPAIINIADVLKRTGGELLGAPMTFSRGVASTDTSATAVLFLGDLPHQNSSRFPASETRDAISRELVELNRLATQLNRHLRFYFVITKHFGNYGHIPGCVNPADYSSVAAHCPQFMNDNKALDRFLSSNRSIRDLDRIKVHLLRVPDRASLALDFIALFSQFDHSVMHSR